MDINCDLGEGYGNWEFGNDPDLMPFITTANIACGFHGGDPVIMGRSIELAVQSNVTIGAHPGFPDRAGFGRRIIPLDAEEVGAMLTYQIGALQGFLRSRGLELNHVKPHGALYGYLLRDSVIGEAAARAITTVAPGCLIYWPAGAGASTYRDVLENSGHKFVGEIYPDLRYSPDGAPIVERRKKLTDVGFAKAQVRRWLTNSVVETEDGSMFPVDGTSICLHSDARNAVEVAKALAEEITSLGFRCAAEPKSTAVAA
ncbi:5-oxoprolinase subunit PxpA [Nocardia sp. NPDC047038]|uniref:5-oxoprolinase subunit PxpA n=1 Tax=Nocardia sp. NPDC047038 TaxID=3154338 RepID=UPI0033F55940